MAINSDKTVRKNVSLPHEVMERVSAYQAAQEMASESEALRSLIEAGLLAKESPDAILERYEKYNSEGRKFNWMAQKLFKEYPHMSSIRVEEGKITFEINGKHYVILSSNY
jgi:hypothetical protein